MRILGFIIDFNSTVHVLCSNIDSLFLKQIKECGLSDHAKIAGNNPVIILRFALEVTQMPLDGICSGRCHARTHIHRIPDSQIHNLPNGNRCYPRIIHFTFLTA
jgi:hypothetical protein